MSDKKYSLEEIGELAEALNLTQKNDPASSTPGAAVLHGPHHNDETQFGIFSTAGVRPQRWSTLVRPRSLARLLGINASVYHQELLEIMTGVTDPAYTNASDFCGDPPTVGAGKVCQQIYNWGEYFVKTDLNALPKIGALRNRADVPAQILNQGPAAHPLVPDLMFRMQDTRSQLQYGLYLVGVGMERSLEHVLVGGDGTLASADTQRGWISEFPGLDSQIKTGYTDAETGI
ncbi:MAG TPA: hypothetical protein VKN76_00380, partial [Kiloniellaceae bacterium]|nr:hypothetical protein [Kiloniellaceae bacterium]